MAFDLLKRHKREASKELANAIIEAAENIKLCQRCRNYSDNEICDICQNERRSNKKICIVENPADLITIEQTQTFNGKYFVLHGNLSPLDGIGPNELGLIDFFINAHDTEIEEIIIATNATIEGDATCHYIGQKLNQMGIKWSQLGRGVPMRQSYNT